MEHRRRQAIAMLRRGWSFRDVAIALGASLSSVVRWCQAHRRQGLKGLRARPTPGRPPRLSERQKEETLRLLVKGARAAGYATELWTLKRIARLIEKHHGVHYCLAGVWNLLRTGLRWSPQKPERRSTQRNDKAIAHWKRHTWPRIKKSPKAQGLPGISRRKRLPIFSSHPGFPLPSRCPQRGILLKSTKLKIHTEFLETFSVENVRRVAVC
ncbi:MAG: transposase [Elusimicrobia bacterium]|nr:transposase [Elusimicrobiota bacterium]